MKKKIIQIVVYIVVVGLLALFFSLWRMERKEKNRIKENFDIEISNEKERLQTLTLSEFKKYYEAEIETLKQHGIKSNQVENIVQIRYNYKDSLIPKTQLVFKDTLIEYFDTSFVVTFSEFDIESKCNIVKGYILSDSIVIQSIETTDNLLISLYKEKRKCIFGKRKVKAIAISECKGDTVTILNNLKVGK